MQQASITRTKPNRSLHCYGKLLICRLIACFEYSCPQPALCAGVQRGEEGSWCAAVDHWHPTTATATAQVIMLMQCPKGRQTTGNGQESDAQIAHGTMAEETLHSRRTEIIRNNHNTPSGGRQVQELSMGSCKGEFCGFILGMNAAQKLNIQ